MANGPEKTLRMILENCCFLRFVNKLKSFYLHLIQLRIDFGFDMYFAICSNKKKLKITNKNCRWFSEWTIDWCMHRIIAFDGIILLESCISSENG